MKFIIGIIVDKVIKAVVEAIAKWLEAQKAKKEAKKKIAEIKRIEDAKDRAAAYNDFLNG